MNINFEKCAVLVTGSTQGIGFAIAKAFILAGATVTINGRSKKSVADALNRLQAGIPSLGLGIPVSGFAGDLGTNEDCERLIAEHPEFDIVVNNIGIYEPKDFFDTTDLDWQHTFNVNVMSGVRLAKAYLPGMIKKNWGRMVFISSESAINIPPEMIHYGLTKTAQLALSRGLAKKLSGTGVTVNSVLPGPTLSEGVQHMLMTGEGTKNNTVDDVASEFIRTHRSSSIIKRASSVDEIANMVIYVCSKQASSTTGAALRVDGGIVDSIY
jgi:NAD(P)-dependent dehydrogenase (short-subunit alcohol dehydrogenase family)